jgi:hypothetical protein
MGRGGRESPGPDDAAPVRQKNSLDDADIYALPVASTLSADGTHMIDHYRLLSGEFKLASSEEPFDTAHMQPTLGQDKFDQHGRWIGEDRPIPHRRFTTSVGHTIPAKTIRDLFYRYDNGDYGTDEGEVGFAVYHEDTNAHTSETLYLVDDAVRTPEGEPPARDPRTSPGPQTLMLSSDY